MGVTLLPLEFSDCLLDSPYFRENLRAHERGLDRTATDVKTLARDVEAVLEAASQLSKAKRGLSNTLKAFQFDCLGTSLTDDEVIVANSLKQFAAFIDQVSVKFYAAKSARYLSPTFMNCTHACALNTSSVLTPSPSNSLFCKQLRRAGAEIAAPLYTSTKLLATTSTPYT